MFKEFVQLNEYNVDILKYLFILDKPRLKNKINCNALYTIIASVAISVMFYWYF